jgi:hypothetical protein
MKDQWNENLRCPTCGKTGKASLTEDNEGAPTVDLVPDGFKIVDSTYGLNFHCANCDVAVKP